MKEEVANLSVTEEKDAVVADLSYVFTQTFIEDEHVLIKSRGFLVDIMMQIVLHIYKKNSDYRNDLGILCIDSLKTSHGWLKIILKIHLKVVKDLEKLGFKLNPSSGHIVNKIVNNESQTGM